MIVSNPVIGYSKRLIDIRTTSYGKKITTAFSNVVSNSFLVVGCVNDNVCMCVCVCACVCEGVCVCVYDFTIFISFQ